MTSKKLFIIGAISLVSIGAAIGSVVKLKQDVTTMAEGHTHTMVYKPYVAPGMFQDTDLYTSNGYGEKQHWICSDPQDCTHYADSSATQELALSDFLIAPFEAAAADEIAEGDLIATVRSDKMKYLDQGTTPQYVKDDGRVAAFISRSNIGRGTVAAESDYRLVFDSSNGTAVSSVTFDYRLYDVGTETNSQGYHHTLLLTDQNSKYDLYNADALVADDAWHSITIDTASAGVGSMIFRTNGLRGHMMIANVSVTGPTAKPTAIVNGGFEDTTGAGWTLSNIGFYASSSKKAAGDYSLKLDGMITDLAEEASLTQKLDGFVAGDSVTLSVFIATYYQSATKTNQFEYFKFICGSQTYVITTDHSSSGFSSADTHDFTLTADDIVDGEVVFGLALKGAEGLTKPWGNIDEFSVVKN